MSKKTLFTIVLVFVIIFLGYKYMQKDDGVEEEKTPEQIEQEEQVAQEAEENAREIIMLAAAQQMNDLSPHETIGKWFPVKFWFDRNDTDNQYVYIDYEDGHMMYRMLTEVLEVDNGLEFSIIGKFESGDEEWELTEGEDYLYGKVFDIYNWNPDTNHSVKVN
ncbi:MAG: hypothetical protein ABIH92_04510 [Nanoarchaeota archaeon]